MHSWLKGNQRLIKRRVGGLASAGIVKHLGHAGKMFVGLLKVAAFRQGKHHLYVVAHIVPHLQGMLNVRNELPATR